MSEVQAVIVNEREDLERLEALVADGLKGWFQAGMALREIRDRRLYKETHSNFLDYAKERWGLVKSSLYQRLWACDVVVELGCPQDMSEYALDMLFHLGDRKKQVWEKCLEVANGEIVTGTMIRSVCATLNLNPPKRSNVSSSFRWPSWLNAQYIAMDADGNWTAFSEKPTINRKLGAWSCSGDETWLFTSIIKWSPPRCDDWEQSLMARPRIMEEAA